MTRQNAIKIFEEKKVRTIWDSDKEEWYFSIIDVISILTDSDNPRRYWSDLKRKLTKEGSQVYDIIVHLKLPAPRWENASYGCCRYRAVVPVNTINPLA